MNEVRKDELIQLSIRRELTPEELSRLEDYFAAHPEGRALWEEERALSRAIHSLPDVPVSSNFTSRVMEALEFDQSGEARRSESLHRRWMLHWLPRLGLVGFAASVAVFSAQRWYQASRHERFAHDVSFAATDLATLPNAELLLRDFDAIRELGQVSAVSTSSDDELLRVLQ
jgi:anti-sigma factor RsiW